MKGMTFIEKKLCNSIVIPIAKLHPFEGHPYKVLDNEEMEMLTESVQNEGVLSPLIVRPLEGTDGYEVISGHRRLHAAQKAGLSKVPALVYEISREEAAIMLVDSNLHREHILPSEKAFAYKLKMEAMKHQGRTSPQVGEKLVTAEKVGADGGDSKNQVLRYVRLTHLIPELLQLVDDGSIALTPAVELSYLPEKAQTYLLEEMRRNDCTPSLSQAIRLKKEYQAKTLTVPKLRSIMGEEKANQKERLKIPMERIRKFFPKSYTPNQIEEAVVKLCENNYRRRTEQER
jgi:ParB family chromosome partitioning protein